MTNTGEVSNARQRLSVKVGDTVAYSKRFLQNIGQYTGSMPFARGKVTDVKAVGAVRLAHIDWDDDELPDRVNIANLSLVKNGVVMDLD